MADTNTPNILLLLPDLNDTFNFGAHVEANFTTIDGLMGAVQCTSTARPTNTYAGQIIYETDSGRYAQNTGTKASPVWMYMSHQAYAAASSARPTVGLTAGQLLYETDNALVRPRGASSWLSNLPTCTSSARPANPVTGDMAVETDTGRVIWWNGSAWTQKAYGAFVCTSSTHPASPFTGLEIFETDTGLSAVYTGSTYLYPVQQIAATQKLGSPTASVTFNGIPSGINNLQLIWKAQSTATGTGNTPLLVSVNGDVTNAHYYYQYFEAIGATTSLGSATNPGLEICYMQATGVSGFSANQFAGGHAEFLGWADASNYLAYTAYSTSGTTTASRINEYGGSWLQTATKTSITITPASGSLAAGSWFTLMGSM